MKKTICLLLCGLLLLSMAGCGKKEENQNTTTADVWLTDQNAKAEEVFPAAMKNLAAMVRNLTDLKAPLTQLSLDAALDISLSLDLPLPTQAGKPLEIYLKGTAQGLADNQKGVYINLKAQTNAQKAMNALFMAGQQEDDNKESTMDIGIYADYASNRLYTQDPDNGTWSASDLNLDANQLDTAKLESMTTTDFFETCQFTVTKDSYIFEGPVNPALDLEEVTGLTMDFKETKAQLKMVFNADKNLTNLELKMAESALSLSAGMPGLQAKIGESSLSLNIRYEAVSYQLPETVKNAAEQGK